MNSILHINKAKNDIVLIGEILIDVIKTEGRQITLFGGSPANITLNMKKLGVEPLLYACICKDYYGDYLLNHLENNQVDLSLLRFENCETTQVFINKSLDSPDVQFQRTSDYLLPYTDILEEKISNTNILHFSYWGLSKMPSKNMILKALKVAKKNKVLVGFDPNYHPDLATEESLSLDKIKELMQYIDIMKPSLDDSKRLFGEGYTYEEYLKKYTDLGVSLVIMTLGKDGLVASYQGQIINLPTLATNVVDVTGAGDAFYSGLYTGLLKGLPIIKSIKLGLACSAFNVEEIGALTALPNYQEIVRKYHI
ncbi:MAG: carbohydrate kinase family protein [Candidatus Izemoplasmataceae bacterium]